MPLLPDPRRLPRTGSGVRSKRSDVNDRPHFAVQIFLYVVCAIWTGLIIPIDQIFFGMSTADADALTTSNWLISLLNLGVVVSGIYLFVVTFLSRKIKYGKYHGLLLICVIVLASTLWSVAPEITVKRSLTFVGSMLLIIYFVEKLGSDRVFRCLVQQLVIIGVISVITRVIWKEYSVLPGTHGLKGIYSHKNIFGAVMAVGVLDCLYLYISDKVRYRYYLWIAVFFLICDVLSTSGTSILQGIIFFYMFSLYLLAARGGFGRVLSIIGSLLLLGVAALAVVAPDALFGSIGKDATLTGRTDLWPYVLDFIHERPWLGWGYRSFWQPDNQLAVDLWNKLGWMVPEAHNGLLELLLDVGYVGCAAFVYVFLASAIKAVQNLKVGNIAIGVAGVMSFVGILLYGVTEEVLLNPDLRSIMFYLIAVSGIHEYRRYRASSLYRSSRTTGHTGPYRSGSTGLSWGKGETEQRVERMVAQGLLDRRVF
jgi:exopolysaccharide production protein ExoQ